MSDIFVSDEVLRLDTDQGSYVGHCIKIDNDDYFIAPTSPKIKVFKVNKENVVFIAGVKVTEEILDRTSTPEGFVQFVYDDVAPSLEGKNHG